MNTDKLQMEGIFKEGYGNISKLVMKDRNLTIGAKAVYAYLCSYSGAGGIAYPSRSLICHDLKISQETLSKHLKNLEEQGYILREQQRSNGSFSHNIYTILTIPRKPDTKITDIEKTDIGKLETNNNSYNNNSNNNIKYNNKEKENIKEKESIRSSSKNTPSLSETSKKQETFKESSKEKPAKKKVLREKEIKNKAIIEEIISYLNEKTNKHFTSKNKQTIKFINGRLSEGYSKEDLKAVIDNRCEKWLNDEKMNEYLRPSTLFRPSKFEAYFNDAISTKQKAITEKEQEFIEDFRGLLTPPDLPPKKAVEDFKKEHKINIMSDNDFKLLEQWYKEKIVEWNKKFSEKIRNERMVELDERTKNQTNEREKCYSGNFNKS